MVFVSSYAVNNQQTGIMRMMGMRVGDMPSVETNMHDDSMTMGDMSKSLSGKSGDSFDKAFVSNMIEHHQGAIDMANQAKSSALHEEIKKMAEDIISAQSREIEMMKQWQKDWGY